MKALLLVSVLFAAAPIRAQSKLDLKIGERAKQMSCPAPSEEDPVTLNVRSIVEGDSIGIVMKVALAPGWHIYAYVPPTLPYIPIDQILQLPENVKGAGEWKKTEPQGSAEDPGVLMYENEAVFTRKAVKLSRGETGVIKAGLYYQTCNLRQCLPPREKTFDVPY
jgi:hypothetical protein